MENVIVGATNVAEVSASVEKKLNFGSALLSTTGDVSSARFVLLIAAGFILIKALAFNIASLAAGHGPVPFDMTDVGILGVVLSGKTIQSFAERGN